MNAVEQVEWAVGDGRHETTVSVLPSLRQVDLRYRIGRILQPVAWAYDIRHWLPRQMECAGTALDIGANNGDFLRVLNATGFQSVGIEPQAPLVKIAVDSGLDVVCGSFPEGVPEALDGRTFDLIAFNEVICYFTDLNLAFSETRKLLKPGGHVLVKAHLATSAYYRTEKQSLFKRFGDNVQSMPTFASLHYWLAHSGFDVVAKAAGPWPRAGGNLMTRLMNRARGFAPKGMPVFGKEDIDVLMVLARVRNLGEPVCDGTSPGKVIYD